MCDTILQNFTQNGELLQDPGAGGTGGENGKFVDQYAKQNGILPVNECFVNGMQKIEEEICQQINAKGQSAKRSDPGGGFGRKGDPLGGNKDGNAGYHQWQKGIISIEQVVASILAQVLPVSQQDISDGDQAEYDQGDATLLSAEGAVTPEITSSQHQADVTAKQGNVEITG